MQEGHNVNHSLPVLMLNSFQKFLSNQRCESLVETSLDTLGWLVGNLN